MFGIDKGAIELPELLSSASLASSMFLFGKLSSGKVAACDTLGEKSWFVIYDNPAAADRPCKIRCAGFAEVTAGEALTAERYVTPGADGKAYHCIGSNIPAGRVLVGTAAAGSRALIWLGDNFQIGGDLAILTHTVDLVNIADGNILTGYPMPFAGRVETFKAIVEKAATTAAKLSNINLEFDTVDATGGVLALTSANMTPIGSIVASSAFTAGNTFVSGGVLDIEASSTTAFVEGRVRLELRLSRRS